MSMISFVFVNGKYAAELSEQALLPDNTQVTFSEQALTIVIAKNTILSAPIHFVFVSKESASTCAQKITLIAEENSQAIIVEEYIAEQAENYSTNNTISIFAERNAQLYYYKIQNENKTASHHAEITIQQKQDSVVKTFFADFGGAKAQQHLRVHLAEKGASCNLHGLYCLSENKQELNNQVHVDHAAEHSSSEILFKGILNKKSRAMFKGKVHVHPQAQRVNALQANHNLLLSNEAEAETKPELEIYADDVKCAHGATVGQIDADALFYLRARGIDKDAAMQLLTQAFAQDVIDKIEHPLILQKIQQQAGYYEAV